MHLDFHLALGRDVAEAAAAGVAVDGDNGQTVAGGVADALVGRQVALVDVLLLFLRLLAQAFLVLLGFGDDGGQLLALRLELFGAVLHQLFGGGDVLLHLLHLGDTFLVLALAELDFEVLELDFLGEGLVFAVVADVVLLFLVLLDLLFVVGDFGVAGLVGGLGLLDVGGEILDAGVQTGNLVLQVLHSLRQLAADLLDFVDFAVDALEGVEGHEAFLDGQVHVGAQDDGGFDLLFCFFGADFLCHFYIYYIIVQLNIANQALLALGNSACKITKFF